MHEGTRRLGTLDAQVVGDPRAPRAIVFLHGHAMRPGDLSPFAHSLALTDTQCVFPQGPVALPDGSHAWWAIDLQARAAALRAGPRDLHAEHPAGRTDARAALGSLLGALRAGGVERLLLAGFSQGGMLAADARLMDATCVEGLALMSASRIAADEWQPHAARLRELPVFISHGRSDPDLAFVAGEGLQAFVAGAGARVSWVPFDGAHEIPFIVWRRFRTFAHAVLAVSAHSSAGSEAVVSYGTA